MSGRVLGSGVAGAIVGVVLTLLAVQLTVGFGADETVTDFRTDGPFDVVVFMISGASDAQLSLVGETLESNAQFFEPPTYCDVECSLEEASVRLADQPEVLELLTADNIPTSWRARAVDGVDFELVERMARSFAEGPGVQDVVVGPAR